MSSSGGKHDSTPPRPGLSGWLRLLPCCCGPLQTSAGKRSTRQLPTHAKYAANTGDYHGGNELDHARQRRVEAAGSSTSFSSSTAVTSIYSEFDDHKLQNMNDLNQISQGDGTGNIVPELVAAELSVKTETELLLYPRQSTVTVAGIVSLVGGRRGSAGSSSARPPVSLSAVLDRSGSMGGAKITLVKRTADFMVSTTWLRGQVQLVDVCRDGT